MTTTARELFEKYADKNSGWGALVVPNNPDAPIDESNHKWRKEHLKTWEAAFEQGRESVLNEIKRISDEFKTCDDIERKLIGIGHEHLYNHLAKLKEPTCHIK